jgi:hypothetical protein
VAIQKQRSAIGDTHAPVTAMPLLPFLLAEMKLEFLETPR